MHNFNKKDALKYSLIAIIAGLFIKNHFYKDNDSLKTTTASQDQKPVYQAQIKHPSLQLETQRHSSNAFNESAIVKEDNNKLLSEVTEKDERLIVEPYKVESDYLNQDFFDEQLCTSDKVRADYRPMLTEALQGLDSQYKHSTYQINQYITLNLYASRLSNYFIKQLQDRIKFIHRFYISMLGNIAKREIVLNVVINPSRNHYEHYVSIYYEHYQSTLGVYFGGLNLAFVDYQQSDNAGLKTAVHEIVHALHAHILGRTPRMFNEGMAEFFEDLIIKNANASIDVSRPKTVNKILALPNFMHDSEWLYENVPVDYTELYYSSWAWIYFMFNYHADGKQALIHFMEKEQVDPCTSILGNEFYSIIQEVYDTFDSDFIDWQDEISLSSGFN